MEIRIRAILIYDFGGNIKSLQENTRIVSRLGHDAFLQNIFQVTFHQSSYYPTTYSLIYRQRELCRSRKQKMSVNLRMCIMSLGQEGLYCINSKTKGVE
jgi:hypothetical protein